MATGKRYYWIKLKESFMTSDTIDYLMSQTDGANYVVLYQMLCLKTINTGGRLSRQIGNMVIPYDIEKIQRDCKWFTIDTVRIALELFKTFGLIYVDVDGVLVLADHNNLVGSETDWSEKKRIQRGEQQKAISGDIVPANVPNVVPADVPENVPIDIRDRDKDIRDKDIRERNRDNNSSCVEPQAGSTPPVITLPLNDGSEYEVSQEQCQEWAGLYPAVDVIQQLKNMRGWCLSNPKRRKTKKGVLRFINGWLQKEQDRGGHYNGAQTNQTQTSANAATQEDLERMRKTLKRIRGEDI